jgi:hypothetical protein
MEFFNDSSSDIEEKLRANYSLKGGYLPSGQHRGNHRTATHLTGIHAQRVADKYIRMGLVELGRKSSEN